MNQAAERLFNIIDSDGDGVITKHDLVNICDKLELEEGPHAFLHKLGFNLDDDRLQLVMLCIHLFSYLVIHYEIIRYII